MKLFVPYVDEMEESDARLVQLAEFLGVPCERLALTRVSEPVAFLDKNLPDACSCLLVNPAVMRDWLGAKGISADLRAFLLSRFRYLLVHGLHASAYDSELVSTLSRGKLQSVVAINADSLMYTVGKDSKRVCGAFSGLSFGPVNPSNDHVLLSDVNDPLVEQLISIGESSFMAAVRLEGTELLFLGSEDVADLNTEASDLPLANYFSKLLPQAMALRYIAGDLCWLPGKPHATIIIDDPLLQANYGFLNFDSLLRLAKESNFHATIAFIPHNFKRNSHRIVQMFRENPEHLSICFHGNDHTEAEFASTDRTQLNTLLRAAEDRMGVHERTTGLACDRVMVFPQGNFSVEAMKALKAHHFYAAVNTVPYPAELPVRLTIRELAQPAVLRYGGFPLFLRKPIRQTQSHDIAFNCFFGRPILIVEHHEVFKRPESLREVAEMINSVTPEVGWSNLANAVSNSFLTQRVREGEHNIRAYSNTVRISNDSGTTRRYEVRWSTSCVDASIKQVALDDVPAVGVEVDSTGPSVKFELDGGSSRRVSVDYDDGQDSLRSLSMRWHIQAFTRRRLSEVRDNYLSKNDYILATAKAFKRRFLNI